MRARRGRAQRGHRRRCRERVGDRAEIVVGQHRDRRGARGAHVRRDRRGERPAPRRTRRMLRTHFRCCDPAAGSHSANRTSRTHRSGPSGTSSSSAARATSLHTRPPFGRGAAAPLRVRRSRGRVLRAVRVPPPGTPRRLIGAVRALERLVERRRTSDRRLDRDRGRPPLEHDQAAERGEAAEQRATARSAR